MSIGARLLGIIALLFSSFVSISAQTSDHQRIGVERKTQLEVSIGLDLEVFPLTTIHGKGVGLDSAVVFEAFIQRKYSLAINLPLALWLGTDRLSPPFSACAFGDPMVEAGYTARYRDYRLSAFFSYRHPSGIWNPYEAVVKGLYSGDGYPTFTGGISAIRFLDPIIMGARIQARTTLERKEIEGGSVRPLDVSLGLSFSNAINGSVAVSLALNQAVALPPRLNGTPVYPGVDYTSDVYFELCFTEQDWIIRLGASKSVFESSNPAKIIFSLSRIIRF